MALWAGTKVLFNCVQLLIVGFGIVKSIEEYEVHLDCLSYLELTQEERDNTISLEQLEKDLGWDKL